MYPILLDQENNVDDTGIDSSTGESIINGMNMDLLPVPTSTVTQIDDFDPQIESVQWLNPDTYRQGAQLFDTRNNSEWSYVDADGNDNARPVYQLGTNVTATLNMHFKRLIFDVMTEPSTDLHNMFDIYGNTPAGHNSNGIKYVLYVHANSGRVGPSIPISLYAANLIDQTVFNWNGSINFASLDPELLIPPA